MTKYSKLLRDPRWQKKRLEIMQRDNFTCTHCMDDKSTLNVHHCYYENGKSPWEYPDTSLLTLCESCHEKETHFLKVMKNGLHIELGKLGARSGHYFDLAIAFAKLKTDRLDDVIMMIQFMLEDARFMNTFFDALDEDRAQKEGASECPPTA